MITAAGLIDAAFQDRARALLLEVAVHEAGHSVIARMVGIRVDRATLRDADGDGRTYLEDDGGLKSVLAALAGRAATEVLLGHATDAGCETDDDTALARLQANGFHDRGFAFDVKMALLADALR
jgi:hypothetical protein